MIYGRQCEKKTVKAYLQKHMKTRGNIVEVTPRSLQVNPSYPYLGVSVDGVVSCPQCEVGIVEVKCPYKNTIVLLLTAARILAIALLTAARILASVVKMGTGDYIKKNP